MFRGHGTVVGILKVGCKKLFTYDLTGVQWEMEPLCVLDFYVHESKQRSGCGKLLFDYMLKVINTLSSCIVFLKSKMLYLKTCFWLVGSVCQSPSFGPGSTLRNVFVIYV